MQHGLELVSEVLAPLYGRYDILEVKGPHWWRGSETIKLGQVFGGAGSSLTTIRLNGSALRGFNSFWKAVPAMVKYMPRLCTLELSDVGAGAVAALAVASSHTYQYI
jgi:hypothetical protein